jgi:hypothetical protein
MTPEPKFEGAGARFSFVSPEFRVEFRGTEAFVSEQIGLVQKRIRQILAQSAGIDTAAVAPPGAARGKVSLETFFQSARTRDGRGALQDSILTFATHMQLHQDKPEFTIEDLNFCFDLLDLRRPKSLANTLGILKRDRRLIQGGSRRGAYMLSEKGKERARRLFR